MPEKEYEGEIYDTGFEALIARKCDNLEFVFRMMLGTPEITRRELAKRMGVTMRTVSRYRSELRAKGWIS